VTACIVCTPGGSITGGNVHASLSHRVSVALTCTSSYGETSRRAKCRIKSKQRHRAKQTLSRQGYEMQLPSLFRFFSSPGQHMGKIYRPSFSSCAERGFACGLASLPPGRRSRQESDPQRFLHLSLLARFTRPPLGWLSRSRFKNGLFGRLDRRW
jgi:hypothetical protein